MSVAMKEASSAVLIDKGEPAGRFGLYFLPDLDLQHVLCVGSPRPARLAAIAQLAREVTVASRDPASFRKTAATTWRHGLVNVRPVDIGHPPILPLPDRQVDLAVLTDSGGARRLSQDRLLREELRRVLKPEGLVYFELGPWLHRLISRQGMDRLIARFGPSLWLKLGPTFARGLDTAVRWDDETTAACFARQGLGDPRWPGCNARRIVRADELGATGRVSRRCGVLLGPAAEDLARRPPEYLCEVARQAGIALEQHRWGLTTAGRDDAAGAVFFLFDRAAGPPQYVAKVARRPRCSARLDNEWRVLTRLAQQGIGDAETVPQPAFFGYHAELAILGRTALEGTVIEGGSPATSNCPYAQAAINWLIDLGAATAELPMGEDREVLADVEQQFQQFLETYWLSQRQQAVLAEQAAILREHQETLPLVVRHGRSLPGNFRVTRRGRIAVLGWGDSRLRGLPLWDLLDFLHAESLLAARRAGIRHRLEGFGRQFFSSSGLQPLVSGSIGSYCQRTGLSQDLVEPLFFARFVDGALREAARLSPARLQTGYCASLLRWCLGRRERGQLLAIAVRSETH